MQLDTSGNLLCYSVIQTNSYLSSGVVTDSLGNIIYTGGSFSDTVMFNKDTLKGITNASPFLARWQPCSKQINLGVNKTELTNLEVELFPNPNNGNFQISISQQLSANSQIEVYNILGEQVYQAPLHATITQIDMSNKAEGLYLYRVITETGTLVGEGKFVIQ